MDIRHLKTLKGITEAGSFSKAAMKLGYTQSTVTAQIQQLEEDLSVKLFEKIGRRMVLTEQGRELIRYTNELLEVVDKIEGIGKSGGEITGELKIASAESLMSYKLQNILTMFRQKAPMVRLHISSLNCADIKNALLKGETDIGLLFDDGNNNENLVIDELKEFPLSLICSTSVDRKGIDLCKNNQLLETSLITNETECIYRKILEEHLKRYSIGFRDTIELGSIEAIKRCVESDLGITYLPRFTAEFELQCGKLKEIKTPCLDAGITAVCAYHKNKWISPAMTLFTKIVKEDFF